MLETDNVNAPTAVTSAELPSEIRNLKMDGLTQIQKAKKCSNNE